MMNKPSEYAVREIEHCWIPMPGGVRLAARIWLPEGAGPQPAILEYIPYRKRDMVRARDERNHPVFAAAGYASLRVDMRGSGDSEGHMPDMYAPDELADARHVIEWIAAQPWCDGKVGMFGTSWGGTASLQAAVDAPAPLKTVIATCATADRFEDDIHWMGGCQLTDSLEWGATLPAILALPPDAATVGPAWREMWEARLEALTFPLANWLGADRRGAYWRRGSTLFQAERLACPILAIGGWADRYANTVMRLVAARPDICRGIVGPWGHHYPDVGEPGPGMDFQRVALAWWDRWLRDAPGPDWPRLRLWRRAFDPPQDRLPQRAGAWVEAEGAEPAGAATFHLSRAGLGAEAEDAALTVPHDLAHGGAAGDTGYFGRVGGLPLDQSADDARALVFDSAPLTEAVDLIGWAELAVEIRRAAPDAQLVCRICDVAPDGRANLVTRQVLNLALDETLDAPAPFAPGAPAETRVTLPSSAYRFAPGHRIRLALSASYWPLVWPEGAADLEALTRRARLTLPCAAAAEAPAPPGPGPAPDPSWRTVLDGRLERTAQTLGPDGLTMSWRQDTDAKRYDAVGLTFSAEAHMRWRASPETGALSCAFDTVLEVARPDGAARIESGVKAVSNGGPPRASGRLKAMWRGEPVAVKSWTPKG